MAWPDLASQVDGLPLVLAGPVLRRVTAQTVTVWFALKEEANVVLGVHDAGGDAMGVSDPTTTIPIGAHLHLLALTAAMETPLAAGQIYTYDLSFTVGRATQSLAEATNNASVAYAPLTQPSFALPPTSLDDLRLLHGSCRKPHGDDRDALALVDGLIELFANDPTQRPHLLMLSGDQIYADDVADALLVAVSDAAKALLGWEESVTTSAGATFLGGTAFPPGFVRETLMNQTGFTTDDKRAHLMSLGEYLAMYLFAWSDTVWTVLPDRSDAEARIGSATLDAFDAQQPNLDKFREGLPAVRRALANIPTYMILDDHEVTDDFNMTRTFCERVYGNPMGRRIVQNGLVAYALCQAWGQTPEQFAQRGGPMDLLQLVSRLDAAVYEARTQQLQWVVGLHSHDDLLRQTGPYRLYHEMQALDYHYTVEHEAFQLLVTDTRTWRAFPLGGDQPSELISEGVMAMQIDSTPALNGRLLIAVVTTNLPPIASIRLATTHPSFVDIYGNDLYDSWELGSASFDRFIAHLTTKLAQDAQGTIADRVVVLSGDVHFAFASRLQYWAGKRIGDTSPQPAKVVVAQLVGSALKNEKADTRGMHDDPEHGYTYVPDFKGMIGAAKHWFAASLEGPVEPEGYVGFAVDALARVGQLPSGDSILVDGGHPTHRIDPDTHLDTRPDWHYRLDYVTAGAVGVYPLDRPTVSGLSGVGAFGRYLIDATAYRDYSATGGVRQIVGRNNLGEVTFHWGAGDDKQVHHTLRWRDGAILWARYDVSLALDDGAYALIRAGGE